MSKDRLYDAFGELIYAMAMADGEVQQAEIDAMEKMLEEHAAGQAIAWSFNYENSKAGSLEDAYKKALSVCIDNGPDAEFENLFAILDKVAAADFVSESEKALSDRLKNDLREAFLKQS